MSSDRDHESPPSYRGSYMMNIWRFLRTSSEGCQPIRSAVQYSETREGAVRCSRTEVKGPPYPALEGGTSHSQEGGCEEHHGVITPHVPRVDTWWGLSQVSSVPVDISSTEVDVLLRSRVTEDSSDAREDRQDHTQDGGCKEHQGVNAPLVPRVDTWWGLSKGSIVPKVLESADLNDLVTAGGDNRASGGAHDDRCGGAGHAEGGGDHRHSQEGGCEEHQGDSTPHVPRVDTWWGLSQESIVPPSVQGEITNPVISRAESILDRERAGGEDAGDQRGGGEDQHHHQVQGERDKEASQQGGEDRRHHQAPQDGGCEEHQGVISPHVPRVDTGWGLSKESIVPISGTDQQTNITNADTTANVTWDSCQQQRRRQQESGTEGKTESLKITPARPYKSTTSSITFAKLRAIKIKSKTHSINQFYKRRRQRQSKRRRQNAANENIAPMLHQRENRDVKSIKSEGIKPKPKILNNIPSNSLRGSFSEVNSNLIMETPMRNAPKEVPLTEYPEIHDKYFGLPDEDQAEKKVKDDDKEEDVAEVKGGENTTIPETTPEGNGTKPEGQNDLTKKKKRQRKPHRCTECDFTNTHRPKLVKHMKVEHNVVLPTTTTAAAAAAKKTIAVVDLSSADSGPVLDKKRRRSSGDEADSEKVKNMKKLRAQLQELKDKRTNSPPKAVKHAKPTAVTEVEPIKQSDLAVYYKKLEEKDKVIGRLNQELEEAKVKEAGKQLEVMNLLEQNEKLKKEMKSEKELEKDMQAVLDEQLKEEATLRALRDEIKKNQGDVALVKKIKDLESSVERYKNVAEVQYLAMLEIKKVVKEKEEKLKFVEGKTICRDYLQGRCRRGRNCKYSHDVPVPNQPHQPMPNQKMNQMLNQNQQVMQQQGVQQQQQVPVVQANNQVQAQPIMQQQPPVMQQQQQQNRSCLHWERGYCKYGDSCFKLHLPQLYNTRPRSGSFGSNQVFQNPPISQAGQLGVIQESPARLPSMPEPVASKSTMDTQVRVLERAAGNLVVSERMMEDQIREMTQNMTSGEEIRKALFPRKSQL